MTERLYGDEAALVAELAAEILARIEDGVVERGQASLVVTGGSTPAPLYDALSLEAAAWDRTWITLSDERWLNAAHADSNERLVKERLLRGEAAKAHFIPLTSDDETPEAAAQTIDARIAALPRPFDAVILGMGEDGHFASLFPDDAALRLGLDPIASANVVAVDRPGAAGSRHRISLTLSALTDARWIGLMMRGSAKLERLRAPAGTPIEALLNQTRVPVEVFWAP